MKKGFLILFVLLSASASTQEKKQQGTGIDNSIHQLATIDERPELDGSITFDQFFKKNFHTDAKITAPLKLNFTVERNGIALNIHLFGNTDAAITQEAIRVVKASGKWKPGIKDGKPVRVMYSYAIKS